MRLSEEQNYRIFRQPGLAFRHAHEDKPHGISSYLAIATAMGLAIAHCLAADSQESGNENRSYRQQQKIELPAARRSNEALMAEVKQQGYLSEHPEDLSVEELNSRATSLAAAITEKENLINGAGYPAGLSYETISDLRTEIQILHAEVSKLQGLIVEKEKLLKKTSPHSKTTRKAHKK